MTWSVLKLGWVVRAEVGVSVVRKTPFPLLFGHLCEAVRNLFLHGKGRVAVLYGLVVEAVGRLGRPFLIVGGPNR